MRLFATIILSLAFAATLCGQEVIVPDSTAIKGKVEAEAAGAISTTKATTTNVETKYAIEHPEAPKAQVNPKAFDTSNLQYAPELGNFVVSGSSESMPGLMGVERGYVGYVFQSGNLTIMPEVFAEKYGYFRGLSTNYGVGGTMEYAFNDKVQAVAFGHYYTNNLTHPNPAIAGYMPTSNFGAYVSLKMHPNLRMNLGVRRVFMPQYRRWFTAPIIEPTVKIPGTAVEIGFDIGNVILDRIIQAGLESNMTTNGKYYVAPLDSRGAPMRNIPKVPRR